MIRPPLPSVVLARHDTDKTGGCPAFHSYGRNFYDHFLTRYRWSAAILEVGIGSGGSLYAWEEFFPNAAIVGIDIDPDRLINKGRIRSLQMDCSDPEKVAQFANEHANYFNVVIDDGSHSLHDQLLAARVLKRCVRLGGLMVIEDVLPEHTPHFVSEGFRVEGWDLDNRRDNAIAWLLKTEN